MIRRRKVRSWRVPTNVSASSDPAPRPLDSATTIRTTERSGSSMVIARAQSSRGRHSPQTPLVDRSVVAGAARASTAPAIATPSPWASSSVSSSVPALPLCRDGPAGGPVAAAVVVVVSGVMWRDDAGSGWPNISPPSGPGSAITTRQQHANGTATLRWIHAVIMPRPMSISIASVRAEPNTKLPNANSATANTQCHHAPPVPLANRPMRGYPAPTNKTMPITKLTKPSAH